MLINRLVIVGLGSIGQRHLRLARKLMPDADIRVLRHKECDSVPEFASGCFTSFEQVISFAPQIAVIASPATCHMKTALPLAKSGVHLLVEKPLATSQDEVVQLLEACREKRTVLMTGYNLRFMRSLQEFRRIVYKKVIGRLLSVRCEIGQYLPSWRPTTDYRQSVSSHRELGGGALYELSHEIDYLRWIFGEIESVKATLTRQSNLDIDVEDTAHLILEFLPEDDGHKLIGTLTLDFIRHDTTRLCTVIGETGSLRWNGLTGLVEQFDMTEQSWRKLFQYSNQRDDSYLAEWQHFLDCIREQKVPLITGEDGLNVLKIIDAARNASESGCLIRLTTNHGKI